MNQYDYNMKNIELSGKRWILSKFAEECAELSAAILQYLNKDIDSLKKIEKEIADVKIEMNYYELMFSDNNIIKYERIKYKAINKKIRKMMKENKRRSEV
jgi:NTP pyrophosphatase (non-canonical NTP hydrolase)